jgi:UDP-GlcNAc:undecaprenyl-phosphate GlcNAc-1-phosphate transferase
VPYLGGVAIVVAFAIAVLGAVIIRPPVSGVPELALILGLGVLLAVVGLLDDLRGLSPYLRFGIEIAAAVVIWDQAASVELFHNDVIDLTITVLWIVGVTNAFNLLDNMDGLSAGVAGIAALSVFVIAADNGQFLVATLAIGITGVSVGFLRRNFHPAQIYMGDAGALFLGFVLAVLALKLRFEGPRAVTFFVPILVLGVALFDTALVTINRLIHRRSPIVGGLDHTSHRLVRVGIPVPVTVALIYVAAASLGTLAIVMSRLDQGTGFILMAWVLVLALFTGGLLSRIPVYETSRRRHLVLQEVERADGVQPLRPRSARWQRLRRSTA